MTTSRIWQVFSSSQDWPHQAIWLAKVKAQGDYDIGLENKMYEVRTRTNLTEVVSGQNLPAMLYDLENTVNTTHSDEKSVLP